MFTVRDKVIKLGSISSRTWNVYVLNKYQLLSVALCMLLFQQVQTSSNFLLYLFYFLLVERIMIIHANYFIINGEESFEINSIAFQ